MICYCYEVETELVVGWLEVALRAFEVLCWCMRRGAWVMTNRNHVDCEAMCGLLGRFCQVELWSVWMYVWTPPFFVISFILRVIVHFEKEGFRSW